MEKKDLNYDNFKGALFQDFENESVNAPKIVWEKIEKELFVNRKRTRFFWLLRILFGSLLLAGSYFLTIKNSSEKHLSDKNRKNVASVTAKNSKSKNGFNTDSEKTNQKNNRKVKSTLLLPIITKEKSLAEKTANTKTDNADISIGTQKTNSENTSQDSDSSIVSSLPELPLFKLPYLSPLLANSFISLASIIEKEKRKNCNQNISFQSSVNRGINVRKIDGDFDSQNMKSRTIGERRIPASFTQYQFGFNYHINDKFIVNSGLNFGKSTFQSRWFYRQFYVKTGENAIELRTINGGASLNDQEIISELATGDTILYKIRANYAASFFSIPLGLTYRFNNLKMSPFIRYGISLDFHSKASISLDIQKNGTFKTTDLNFQNNSFRVALQQMASLGFEYRFNNNWSSFLESRIALPVSKINLSTDYKVKSSYLTLGVGIIYKLPCKK